jgi:hypothetical protein
LTCHAAGEASLPQAFVRRMVASYGLLDVPEPAAPYFTFVSRQNYAGRNISRSIPIFFRSGSVSNA